MKKCTKSIGDFGEGIAADFYIKEGYKIRERNYHHSHNEIDIIAENERFVVFVEVKTRSVLYVGSGNFGRPASSVDYEKQKRTVAAAQNYIIKNKLNKQPRIDVVEVYLKKKETDEDTPIEVLKINHIRNAFGR